jgi:hypothetical protein
MRRLASVLLFVLGGWMLSGEILTAFLDVQPGVRDSVIFIGLFGLLAALPLLLGMWASPGRRAQELGLTVLLGVGFGAFAAVGIGLMMVDPKAKALLPPMQGLGFTPVVGAANLVVLVAGGLLLYRSGSAPKAEETA